MRRPGDRTKSIPRWVSIAEVLIFYSLAQILIWGPWKFRPPILLVAFLMVGICIFSNWFHGDTQEKIGLAKENFIPNLKLVAPVTLVCLIPIIIPGWGKKPLEGWDFWFAALGYPIWGFAQEYALLGFVANRLEEGLPSHPRLVPWINGFLFSMTHLPNPLLISLTFILGVLFTHIFFKKRHLIPLALAHALFGVGLSIAFGDIKGIMSVGPGYLLRMGK